MTDVGDLVASGANLALAAVGTEKVKIVAKGLKLLGAALVSIGTKAEDGNISKEDINAAIAEAGAAGNDAVLSAALNAVTSLAKSTFGIKL
jgi:hypothetical protein